METARFILAGSYCPLAPASSIGGGALFLSIWKVNPLGAPNNHVMPASIYSTDLQQDCVSNDDRRVKTCRPPYVGSCTAFRNDMSMLQL